MDPAELRRRIVALKSTAYFAYADDKDLKELAVCLVRVEYPKGKMIVRTGETVSALIIAEGEVQRWYSDGDRAHIVKTYCDRSVGLLHLYNSITTSRFNAQCLTDVVAYCLLRADLEKAMASNRGLSTAIITGLSSNIRQSQFHYSTPLLEQMSHHVTLTSTTIAACIEAFYRSGMTHLYNQVVMHKTTGSYFPNMHVQVPVRVAYLNGLKQTRRFCDTLEAPSGYERSWRALMSFVPGMAMCPLSSILEASNAGDMNKLPMSRRWMCGYAPRLVREVMFGVGINQMADFCTERLVHRVTDNRHVQGSLGSFSAGLVAGYITAVPNTLGTMKLHQPHRSYASLWSDLSARTLDRVPAWVPQSAKHMAAQCLAVAFPVGNLIRSAQIGGTFIIVNGTTYALRNKDWY